MKSNEQLRGEGRFCMSKYRLPDGHAFDVYKTCFSPRARIHRHTIIFQVDCESCEVDPNDITKRIGWSWLDLAKSHILRMVPVTKSGIHTFMTNDNMFFEGYDGKEFLNIKWQHRFCLSLQEWAKHWMR